MAGVIAQPRPANKSAGGFVHQSQNRLPNAVTGLLCPGLTSRGVT